MDGQEGMGRQVDRQKDGRVDVCMWVSKQMYCWVKEYLSKQMHAWVVDGWDRRGYMGDLEGRWVDVCW